MPPLGGARRELRSRKKIRSCQPDENEKPEEARSGECNHQCRPVAQLHEDERDDQRLGSGDGERDRHIEGAQRWRGGAWRGIQVKRASPAKLTCKCRDPFEPSFGELNCSSSSTSLHSKSLSLPPWVQFRRPYRRVRSYGEERRSCWPSLVTHDSPTRGLSASPARSSVGKSLRPWLHLSANDTGRHICDRSARRRQ